MNAASTLMIDLVPDQSSSVTACVSELAYELKNADCIHKNNLSKCILTATLVSVLDPMINGIGIGWTYVLLGGLSILSLPLICGAMIIGPKCRINRQHSRDQESVIL